MKNKTLKILIQQGIDSHARDNMDYANSFSASCTVHTYMPLADFLAQVLTAFSAQVTHADPFHKLVSIILLKHIALQAPRMMLRDSRKYNEAFKIKISDNNVLPLHSSAN